MSTSAPTLTVCLFFRGLQPQESLSIRPHLLDESSTYEHTRVYSESQVYPPITFEVTDIEKFPTVVLETVHQLANGRFAHASTTQPGIDLRKICEGRWVNRTQSTVVVLTAQMTAATRALQFIDHSESSKARMFC